MRDVIEMAREANLLFPGVDVVDGSIDQLKRFAELVRADERGKIAQMCDEIDKESQSQWPKRIATMIRARENP
jgi:hypothetical protein